MPNWIYFAGSGLLTVFLAFLLVSRRQSVLDLEPVSQHWLAEQKRARETE